MSDRLAELVRQRALVQEHLAWLNQEIAAAAEAAKATASPTPTANTASPSPATTPSPADSFPAGANASPAVAAAATANDPDEIIARYQVAPGVVKQDVRKGCLLYFAGAFVLLGLVLTVLYLAIGRNH